MLRTAKLRGASAALAAAVIMALTPAVVSVASENATDAPTDATDTPPAAPPTKSPGTPPDIPGLSSAPECWEWVEVSPGRHEYVYVCETPGEDDSGEDDGEGEWDGPTCDLSHEPYSEFCMGERACWADIPSTIPEENWPERGRESDSEIFTYYECFLPPDGEPDGRFGWIDPYDESLPDEGWAAWGKLQTPAFTLSFEPNELTYVGADTRFEVDGIGDGEIVGGQAGPLQAFGTFSHVEIDPGDSSATFTCDNDADTDDCEHVYLETSQNQPAQDLDGRGAYTAQARLVYDVIYTMRGEPISLPGVPDTLESPWNGTLVPVGEIQVLVQ